jgi:undecaprenyl-diphosphatase
MMPVMQELNLAFYESISTARDPSGLLLWFAMHGSSLLAVLVAWVILRHPKERWYGCAVVVAAALASLLARSLADTLDFDRPYMMGLGDPRIPHGERPALPSAHATVMFSVALLLARRPSLRILSAGALVLTALTCWGRVYAGVHFPLDIAAGALLALLIAASVHLLARQLPRVVAPLRAAWPQFRR